MNLTDEELHTAYVNAGGWSTDFNSKALRPVIAADRMQNSDPVGACIAEINHINVIWFKRLETGNMLDVRPLVVTCSGGFLTDERLNATLDTPVRKRLRSRHTLKERLIMQEYTSPEQRRANLISLGLSYARETHYRTVPIKQICADEGVSHTLVFHYFAAAAAFHDAILKLAVESPDLRVLAQGLADHNPIAQAAPDALKRQALDTLL